MVRRGPRDPASKRGRLGLIQTIRHRAIDRQIDLPSLRGLPASERPSRNVRLAIGSVGQAGRRIRQSRSFRN